MSNFLISGVFQTIFTQKVLNVIKAGFHRSWLNLFYNKTIVDLCFGRHGVLLNSKLNHIDLHSASVSYDVYCSIKLHVQLNIS